MHIRHGVQQRACLMANGALRTARGAYEARAFAVFTHVRAHEDIEQAARERPVRAH
jgi:hypothetical protein